MTIGVGSAWHAEKLGDPKNSAVLSQAVKVVLGSAPRVAAVALASPASEPDEIDEARGSEPAAAPDDVVRAAFGDVEEV